MTTYFDAIETKEIDNEIHYFAWVLTIETGWIYRELTPYELAQLDKLNCLYKAT